MIRNKLTQKYYSGNQNLPSPVDYYRKIFPHIKIRGAWTKVLCTFHGESNPSLSINLREGHFRCFSCGTKGNGIIAFHKLLKGFHSYKEAARDLEASRF